MDTRLISSAALSSQGGVGGTDDPVTPKVDNKVRRDWNLYTQWLDKKGLKGHPSLDKNDLGGKMIDQYRKENTNTTISRDMITPIQKEFSNYRDYALKQVDKGKLQLGPGVTKDNFLRALSIVDNIPGQRTTSFEFPLSYMKTFEDGKLVKTENKGFATMK